VAVVCVDLVPNLVGVYVHGSAALGGFGPASDLDVLVVTNGDADWPTVGDQLLVHGGRPRTLELSVVRAEACAHPTRPWPYVLHVNSSASRFNLDPGAGDPDLIAHYAVARAAGVAIVGPPAIDVFGPVQPAELTAYLRGELRDSLEQSDQRYAVLNACRATAFSEERLLLSKTDGARWWLRRFGPEPLVTEALGAQERGEDLGPCSAAARVFVATTVEPL
jgi:streptomycin 3"-adenylyltransferase